MNDDRVYGITGTVEGHAGGRITIDLPVVAGAPNQAEVQALLVGLARLLADYGQVLTSGGVSPTVQVGPDMEFAPLGDGHLAAMLAAAKRQRANLKDPVEAHELTDKTIAEFHSRYDVAT